MKISCSTAQRFMVIQSRGHGEGNDIILNQAFVPSILLSFKYSMMILKQLDFERKTQTGKQSDLTCETAVASFGPEINGSRLTKVEFPLLFQLFLAKELS